MGRGRQRKIAHLAQRARQKLRYSCLSHLVMVPDNLYQVLVKLFSSFDERRGAQMLAPFLLMILLLTHTIINITLDCQLELFVLFAIIVSWNVFLLSEDEG